MLDAYDFHAIDVDLRRTDRLYRIGTPVMQAILASSAVLAIAVLAAVLAG